MLLMLIKHWLKEDIVLLSEQETIIFSKDQYKFIMCLNQQKDSIAF